MFFIGFFIRSSGRHWYCKKKFLIPTSVIFILCIVAVALGLTLPRKTISHTLGIQNTDKRLVNRSCSTLDIVEVFRLYSCVYVILETKSKTFIPGICRNAQWKASGDTVAGGKYLGDGFDQLNSPDGIFVEEDGTVYISDGNNQRIIRWNPDTSYGYLLAGGNGPGQASNQFDFPVDVFVDRNATMYVTDFRNKRVQQWLSGAVHGQTLVSNRTYIGVWVDDEGSLYTSDWADNAVRKWRQGDSVGQILGYGFNKLDRLYVDQNQSVYAVDRGNHSIIRIDQSTENVSIVAGGRRGQSLSALNSPRGVTVDELGNVYVADTNNHRIVRWAPGATSGILIVGGRGDGSKADQLQRPTDLQFDGYGNLYVADSGNNRIQKFVIDKSLC